ncbi:MAG: NAD+ synthase [Chloroflexi bacterium RBG_13_46_9]|nr:MAG: NAD+ synthase [Chloroflexi bacterium RBG_13_46_9]
MCRLRIAMAQINTTVGDFDSNVKKILENIDAARSKGADIVTFPELAVCGYPPEDLLFKPQFIQANLDSLQKIAHASQGITVVTGFVDTDNDIYNAAAILNDGKIAGIYHKIYLPNYGVFDENRYFRAGSDCPVFIIGGVGIGITICEDIWYEVGPATVQANSGAEVIINISASPYHAGKGASREKMIATRAADNVAIFAYNNAIGGQDELVFDGHSVIMDEKGNLIARGKQFEEDLIIADLDVESVFRARLHDPRQRKEELLGEQRRWNQRRIVVSEKPFSGVYPVQQKQQPEILDLPTEVYRALVVGTRDYVRKSGFNKVVIGLSGGIDSAIVAAIAADALGGENVVGVSMPSRYSSEGSKTDAQRIAENFKFRLLNIPIEKIYQAYLDTLSEPCTGTAPDTTEENVQARIRGNLLMALSNKFGWLVLTTGNKSEYATGYTTLYGDMAGGFAVIKDVPKTLVYKIARKRNQMADREMIPESVFTKPPSAELRPDQKDTDSLPPYEILDPILTAYVEDDKSVEQIIALGFDKTTVQKTAKLVDRSEYKRRQAPPGVKITTRAFGRDRRLPIVNHFKEW